MRLRRPSTQPRLTALHCIGAVALLGAATACGDGKSVDNAIVQAVSTENDKVKAKEAIEAKAAELAKAKAAEAKAKEAAIEDAIHNAAVAPAQPPANLEEACESVVNAYDAYMKSGNEKDALLWSDGRRRKLGERRTACVKVGSLAVAACETQALGTAPKELDTLPRKVAARRLMERCNDKFAGT